MGSTMALLRPCLCETTSAFSVGFLRFFAWFDHWCIWDNDACRSASPFPFLWADLFDNTLLMVFNSAEPTVALPCMAGLVSLSFGRLKFRDSLGHGESLLESVDCGASAHLSQ